MPPPTPPTSGLPGFDECAELKKTLALARRALAHLERQQTGLGLYAPAHIAIEIEDKQQQIRGLEARLDELECAE